MIHLVHLIQFNAPASPDAPNAQDVHNAPGENAAYNTHDCANDTTCL